MDWLSGSGKRFHNVEPLSWPRKSVHTYTINSLWLGKQIHNLETLCLAFRQWMVDNDWKIVHIHLMNSHFGLNRWFLAKMALNQNVIKNFQSLSETYFLLKWPSLDRLSDNTKNEWLIMTGNLFITIWWTAILASIDDF